MTGAPITAWQACSRCAHGRRGGLACAHPVAACSDGAPAPVDAVRSSAHLCGPDGRWHEYAAPAAQQAAPTPAAAPAAALA